MILSTKSMKGINDGSDNFTSMVVAVNAHRLCCLYFVCFSGRVISVLLLTKPMEGIDNSSDNLTSVVVITAR